MLLILVEAHLHFVHPWVRIVSMTAKCAAMWRGGDSEGEACKHSILRYAWPPEVMTLKGDCRATFILELYMVTP